MRRDILQSFYNLLEIQNDHLAECRKMVEYSANINYAVMGFIQGLMDGQESSLKLPKSEGEHVHE